MLFWFKLVTRSKSQLDQQILAFFSSVSKNTFFIIFLPLNQTWGVNTIFNKGLVGSNLIFFSPPQECRKSLQVKNFSKIVTKNCHEIKISDQSPKHVNKIKTSTTTTTTNFSIQWAINDDGKLTLGKQPDNTVLALLISSTLGFLYSIFFCI